MVALIVTSIERGEAYSAKNTEMFVSESDPLLVNLPYLRPERWTPGDFPDEQGQYPNLEPVRRTARQIYNYEWPEPEYEASPVAAEMKTVVYGEGPSPDLEPFIYQRKDGDTWESLAEKFSVTVESILHHNGAPVGTPLPDKVLVPWW
jgi:hypothetical protein